MKNDAYHIFIVSNKLNIAKDLLINKKIYKISAVINLNQTTNLEKNQKRF